MERYRIEWRQGPTMVGGDSWVIDLDLLTSLRSGPFRLAKHLQVVTPTEDLERLELTPDWPFWRALVAVAARTVISRIQADTLRLERPREPLQLVPDVAEAAERAAEMVADPVVPDEVMSELASD